MFPNPDCFWVAFPTCPLFRTSPRFSGSPLHCSPPHAWAGGVVASRASCLGTFPMADPAGFSPPGGAVGTSAALYRCGRTLPHLPSVQLIHRSRDWETTGGRFCGTSKLRNIGRGVPLVQSFCFTTRKQMKSPIRQCFSYADSVNFIADFTVRCIYFTSQDFSRS